MIGKKPMMMKKRVPAVSPAAYVAELKGRQRECVIALRKERLHQPSWTKSSSGAPRLFCERPRPIDSSGRTASSLWLLARSASSRNRAVTEARREVRDGDPGTPTGRQNRHKRHSE